MLESLGARAITDTSRSDAFGGWSTATRVAIKSLLTGIPVVKTRLPAVWQHQALRSRLAAPIDRFVSEQIRTTRLYGPLGGVKARTLRDVDVLLVGSDQVWRDAYGDVPSFLFDFAEGHPAVKASYAASFGIDDPRAESTSTDEWRALARKLDSVSVREKSGAEFARLEWGVDARVDLDPTLLLDADHYAELSRDIPVSRGAVQFVLDYSATVGDLLHHVEAVVGPMRILMPAHPTDFRAYATDPSLYDRPNVAEWLAAFRDADFVVTDSFHGTVFAIINRKPFLTIINSARGRARFDTLLSTVGLSSRLLTLPSDAAVASDLATAPIDWDDVESRLAPMRDRGRAYLRSLLSR